MTTKEQSAVRGSKRGFPCLTIHFHHHTPHWTRPGVRDGWAMATFEVCTIPGKQWIAIDTVEHNTNRSSKRTMVTLDEQSARALHDLLKSQYEPTNGS